MDTEPPEEEHVAIADAILDRLRALGVRHLSDLQREITALTESLGEVNVLRRKVDICVKRGWLLAAKKLKTEVSRFVRNLPYRTTGIEQALKTLDVKVPSLRELVADVQQLEREFGDVEFDGEALSITTEAIELEGLHLGEFQVDLDLPSLGSGSLSRAYQVVALDPHPASCDDSVTHPHVRDENLCAGDAAAAINQALMEGRVCDFFMLVRSVLTHYNPSSPYVALEAWNGIPCYDCGYSAAADEVYFCYGCEHDFCDECSSYCRRCEEPFCHGCLQECVACEDSFCSGCIVTCANCGRMICQSCLEEGECPCHEEEEDDEPEECEDGREDGIDGVTVDRAITGQGAPGQVVREEAVG